MTYADDKQTFVDPGPTSPRNAPSLADAVKGIGDFLESLQDIIGYDPDLRQGFGSVAELLADLSLSVVPTGAIIPFGGTVIPDGWILCDGSSVLRTTYANLFGVIGTNYGNVDGTHFNLPNLQGRFPLGKAASGTGSTMGASGGSLQHTHTYSSHQHTAHPHHHVFDPAAATTSTGSGFIKATVPNTGGTTKADLHSHTVDIPATDSSDITDTQDTGGGGTTSQSDPPYLVVNYLIRL